MTHPLSTARDTETDALFEAIRALAADGLEPLDLALRLEQYERCAFGARCPEVAFDPVARRLVAHAAALRTSSASLAWGRWVRRVRALFTELRGASTETPVHNADRVAHVASRSAPPKAPRTPQRRGTRIAKGDGAPRNIGGA